MDVGQEGALLLLLIVRRAGHSVTANTNIFRDMCLNKILIKRIQIIKNITKITILGQKNDIFYFLSDAHVH